MELTFAKSLKIPCVRLDLEWPLKDSPPSRRRGGGVPSSPSREVKLTDLYRESAVATLGKSVKPKVGRGRPPLRAFSGGIHVKSVAGFDVRLDGLFKS